MSWELLFFGKIAVEKGYLTESQLEEALSVQKSFQQVGFSEPLGEICVKLGFLSPREAEEILQMQRKSSDSDLNRLYGKVAVANGLVSSEELSECLEKQQEGEKRLLIGQLLMQENLISINQHYSILKAIDRLNKQAKKKKVSPEEREKTRIVTGRESQLEDARLYGTVAVQSGFVTDDQLSEFYRSLEEGENFSLESLKAFLLEREYLTPREDALLEQRIKNYLESRELLEKTRKSLQQEAAVLTQKEYLERAQRREAEVLPSFPPPLEEKDLEKVHQLSQVESELREFFPHYILMRKLGRGGTAVVFKAFDKREGETVALKILPPSEIAVQYLSPNLAREKTRQDRFLREARILRDLQHENLIFVKEVKNYEDYSYYAMEYIEGETLSNILNLNRPLEEEWALEIAMAVARALEHGWENSIIHRDVKPDNIFITREGQVKLFDFGLARPLDYDSEDIRLTKTNVILGTPSYMAPERSGLAEEKKIDIRSDIYSLGVTLFHLITGRLPYYHKSPLSLILMHVREEIPNPQEERSQISTATSQLIQKMMAKEPSDRFQTPGEVVEKIEEILCQLKGTRH